MDTRAWHDYFRHNRDRSPAIVPSTLSVPTELQAPLLAALRTFQAGETGEGRIVHQARQAAPTDPDFQEALRLYIAEEGRHALELGALVRALGGSEKAEVPTARAFVVARRAAGFWTKMVVLTAAEVVGIVFYELLVERVPTPPLASVLATIVKEERAHILFQRDTFVREAGRGRGVAGRRAGVALAVGAATAAAVAAFAIDQAALLRALGVGPIEVARRAEVVARWAVATESPGAAARPSESPAHGPRTSSASPFAWLDAA